MSMASFIHIVEGGDISSFDMSSPTMSSKIFAQQCSSSHFFVHIIIDDTSFFLVDKSVAATFSPLPHLSPAKQQGSFHQSWLRVRGRDERTARSATKRRGKLEGKKREKKTRRRRGRRKDRNSKPGRSASCLVAYKLIRFALRVLLPFKLQTVHDLMVCHEGRYIKQHDSTLFRPLSICMRIVSAALVSTLNCFSLSKKSL